MDCQNAETRMDFLQCLETDVSMCIMSRLDDPADVVRASSVSHTWRDFMIANGLAKNLCLKRFPQLCKVVGVAKTSEELINSVKMGFDKEGTNLEKDHEVYAALLHALTKSKVRPKDCKINGISASSTDNYPRESIANTLNPRDRFAGGALYWSSKGERNPDVPETLIYKLGANMCLVTEIDIHPFEAFFQMGRPIYAARFVRIRIGHPKDPRENIEKELQQHGTFLEPADDKFVWTYTSPEFPMFQENYLQQFKLPDPVFSIDGYVQIELLGRVRRQDSDGLYYICVNHVRVLGRPLYPAFNMEILEPYEKLLLSYDRENLSSVLYSSSGYYDDGDDYGIIHLDDLEGDVLRGRIGFAANPMRGIQQRPLLY